MSMLKLSYFLRPTEAPQSQKQRYFLRPTKASQKNELRIAFSSASAIDLEHLAKALSKQNGIKPEIVHIFVHAKCKQLNALMVCTTRAVFDKNFHSNERPLEMRISPIGPFPFPEGFEAGLKDELQITKEPGPISLHLRGGAKSSNATEVAASPFLEYSIHDFRKGEHAQCNKIAFDFFDGFDMQPSEFQTMMQKQMGFCCATMSITIRNVHVSPTRLLQLAIETRRTGIWAHGSLKQLKLVLIGCNVHLEWLRNSLHESLGTNHWLFFDPTNQSLCINAREARDADRMISNFFQEFTHVNFLCKFKPSPWLSVVSNGNQFHCSINPRLVEDGALLKPSLDLIPDYSNIRFSIGETARPLITRNQAIAKTAFANREVLDLFLPYRDLPPDDFFDFICGANNRKLTLRFKGRHYDSQAEIEAEVTRFKVHGAMLADLIVKKMAAEDDVLNHLEAFDVFWTNGSPLCPMRQVEENFPIINGNDRADLDYYLVTHRIGEKWDADYDWICQALAASDSSNDAANLSVRFHYLSDYIDKWNRFVTQSRYRRVRQRSLRQRRVRQRLL